MADYRNDDDRTLPGVGMNRTPETDPEHLLPDHTSAIAPGTIPAASMSDDPDTVRDEIERTRERMSRTIDQLDRALVRKKVEVQEKLDVAAPVRQKPWVYAGGVFATGLALGLITGGGKKRDDEDDDHVKIPRELLAAMGLEQARRGRSRGGSFDGDVEVEYTGEGSNGGDWESRARELMSVVARQEEEIRSLRGADLDEAWEGDEGYLSPTDARLLDDVEALDEVEDDEEWDEDWNFEEGEFAESYGDSYTGDLDADLYLGSEYETEGNEAELEEYARRGVDFKKPLALLFAAGVAGALGKLGQRLVTGRDDEELLDVEVELEPRGGIAEYVHVDEAGRNARRAARHASYRAEPGPVRGTRRTVEYGPEYGVEGELDYTAQNAYTGRPGYTGEMEVEVELERPVKRSLPTPRRVLRVSPLAGAVAAGAAAAVSGMVAKLIQSRAERAHEMEVEVELERPRVQPVPRRSPAPWAPAQGYTPRPSSAPRSGTGEMEVEVELEGRGQQPATGNWTPSPHLEQGIQGSAFGSTGSTSSRPSDLDVDAETRGATGAAGDTGAGNSGTGNGSSNPPLM